MATTSPSSALPIMSDRTTSILVRFTAGPDVTTDQYDETIRRLEKSGDWKPDGLELHVAFGKDGNFRVSEIWDSQEQFDTFGKRLMPLLKDVGIDLPGDPEIVEIHNVVMR
jgi:hypothetical protein